MPDSAAFTTSPDRMLMATEERSPDTPVAAARASTRAPVTFVALYAAGALLPLLLLVMIGIQHWHAVRADAARRVDRTAAALAEQALRLIALQETLLDAALAQVSGLGPDEMEAAQPKISAFLMELTATAAQRRPARSAQPFPFAISIVRLDSGRIVAWSAPMPVGDVDVADRDYVRALRTQADRTYIGETIVTRPGSVQGYTVSRRSQDGRTLAVTLAETQELIDFYSALREDDDDALALARDDGALLARLPQLVPLAGFRLGENSVLLRFLRGELPPHGIAPFAIDDVERLYRIVRVGAYPLAAVYGLPTAAVRDEWLEEMGPVAFLTLLAMALLFALTRAAAASARGRLAAQTAAAVAAAAAREAQLLAKQEARLRFAMSASSSFVFEWDIRRDRVRRLASEEPALPVTEDDTLAGVARVVHPDDRARFRANVQASLAAADGAYASEHRVVRPDGSVHWLAERGQTEFGQDRRPLRLIGVSHDITGRKEAEIALIHSEKRTREREAELKAMFDVVDVGIAEIDAGDGRILKANPALSAITGWSESDLPGMTITQLTHPDDENRAAVAMAARSGKPSEVEQRCVRKDGSIVWIAFSSAPIPDSDPPRAVSIIRDVTARHAKEQLNADLVREVNHRAKNLLALVQAIARQTAATGGENFVARFQERLGALAANHDLLVRSQWQSIALAELAHAQLAPYRDLMGDRITLQGPTVRLSASAAQALGMAFHELVTNASKYGALSNAAGRVVIAWTVDAAGELAITWTESGGPPVTPPPRRGFGSTVIEQLVATGVGGKVTVDYRPEGLIWRLSGVDRSAFD